MQRSCCDIFEAEVYSVFNEKNHKLGLQKCQNIVVGGFRGTHGKLASGFTNMVSYFWTDYESQLTQCSATQKQQIIEKEAIGFPSKHLCKYIVT